MFHGSHKELRCALFFLPLQPVKPCDHTHDGVPGPNTLRALCTLWPAHVVLGRDSHSVISLLVWTNAGVGWMGVSTYTTADMDSQMALDSQLGSHDTLDEEVSRNSTLIEVNQTSTAMPAKDSGSRSSAPFALALPLKRPLAYHPAAARST